MKNATTTNKKLTLLLSSACALLTACGGSALDNRTKPSASDTQIAAVSAAEAPAEKRKPAAPQPVRAVYVVERTSYTLSSSREFKGFNAELWSNRPWYECNCSSKREAAPGKMPW